MFPSYRNQCTGFYIMETFVLKRLNVLLHLKFQSLQNDTTSRKPNLEEIEKLISELEPLCEEDIPEVKEQLEKLKKHLDEIEKLGDERQKELSAVQDKVEKFNSAIRPAKDRLSAVEATLPKLTLYGADKQRIEEVNDELKKLQKQIDDVQNKVGDMTGITDDLLEQHPTTDSKHLRDEKDDVKERLDKLKANVDANSQEVEDMLKDWNELENDIQKASEAVNQCNKDIDNNKPKKLDVEELACQVENIQAVEASLDENAPLFDDVQKKGRKLRDKGIGSDTFGGIVPKIDEQVRDIKKDLPEKVSELEKLKDALNDFNKKLEDADKDMSDVEKKVDDQKPVGGDKNTIDEGMKDLKDLLNELEPLQEKVNELNDIRANLKNKYPDADSSKIDEPLDELKERLANINQKVSDRQGKLEDALVQCGQFDDAIQSLIGWLNETKELVDNQKPISAVDENVLKAQIQEQKVEILRLCSLDILKHCKKPIPAGNYMFKVNNRNTRTCEICS